MAQQLPVMRIGALAAAACLASCATAPEPSGPDAKLSAELSGKVAGKAQSCIRLDEAHSAEIFRDAIVYRAGRKLTYVNASPGCRAWSGDPIFVNEVHGSELCRGDVVRTVARVGGMTGPVCILGDFTPYRVKS